LYKYEWWDEPSKCDRENGDGRRIFRNIMFTFVGVYATRIIVVITIVIIIRYPSHDTELGVRTKILIKTQKLPQIRVFFYI